MASVKKNFFYSSILTTANYIFPFLTYPYVSRVLGVTNIGICNFIDGIIYYFMLFSMMGITTIGVREVAKAKGDKAELNKAFSSLFLLNTCSTTIVLIIYLIAIQIVPQLHQYKEVAYIGCIKLIGNYLLIEWLYNGLEDFKYITKRTLLIKCLYVVCVFLFVKHTKDYPIYFFLFVSMVGINSLVNIVHARKFVTLTFKGLNFKPYYKPILTLGSYMVLTSMYTSFNVAYLGFATNPTQVGYYTTATKIYSILLALFTAFTTVMLPRMSSLLHDGKIDEFKRMVHKSVDILMAFSIPVIIMVVIFAPQIIHIISGAGYEGAIVPMRIVIPLMFIIGYAQILVVQILMPLQKDNAILKNSILGAVSGIIMNILLVHKFGAIGSAIVWIISEVVVTLSAQYFTIRFINYRFPVKQFFINIVYYIPLIVLSLFIYSSNTSIFFQVIFACLSCFIYCFILQCKILKNPIAISIFSSVKNKICH